SGAWTTGMESSRALARAGMTASEKAGLGKKAPIDYFDPSKVELKSKKYDAVCVRNVFSGIANKSRLLGEIEKTLRPGGHLVIYDLALSAEDVSTPELHTWRVAEEIAPQPCTLDELSAYIAEYKFDLRVSEDVTAEFRARVIKGWSE